MIGIDVEDVSRFKLWKTENFARLFTGAEIAYAQKFKNSAEHFCGFYCVKEAFVKATGGQPLDFKQIEVLHTETGKPYINKTDYILSVLKKTNLTGVEVSISHTKSIATAIVVLT